MEKKIKYDGDLFIASGHTAQSRVWHNKKVTWSWLVERLSSPTITRETYRQFMNASKIEQGRIKDVGGYVGGYLKNGRRDKLSVKFRQLLTLDIDYSNDNIWWDFCLSFSCAAFLHITHKSCSTSLRHRLVIPLDREVTTDEYQAIARMVASKIGIDLFDQSTFDVNRLMFWPSVSSDQEYSYEFQDEPFLSADYILGLYNDWTDVSEWPTSSNIDDFLQRESKKQEDPLSKQGMVGVFCRTYSPQEAIEKFLPDVYAKTSEGRYTYLGGTTASGLIIYEDKFAYSHHATDPACNKLCNSFDLVRLHRFGESEYIKDEKESYKKMEEFASKDNLVKKTIANERLNEAKYDFSADMQNDEDYSDDWLSQLEVNTKGEYTNTSNNINLILKNDRHIKGAFRLNIFDNKRYIARSTPWRSVKGYDTFRDVDYCGLRNYLDCIYGIVSAQKIDDALSLEFERNSYHPIRDYIKSITWDGRHRVDTLLIDYFGAVDNSYTRAAIRKMLTAAVARVFEPGIKFDMALILVGEQGTYKSTFIKKLGKDWFTDTFSTIQGKESFEQIQGAWLVEMAELSGLRKADIESIKHYISKREDSFRPAYGRVVETYYRQCVFFGTTNNIEFLRDPTGNRRFMPIDVRHSKAVKSVFGDLTDDEIDQIWAEAYQNYQNGETLYLSGDEESIAKAEQISHFEVDERMGIIEAYLDKLYPDNWADMDIPDRRRWLDDPLAKKGTLRKSEVCVAEIWCECLGNDKRDMSRYATRDINDILKSMEEWAPSNVTKTFPNYGRQRYYQRIKK